MQFVLERGKFGKMSFREFRVQPLAEVIASQSDRRFTSYGKFYWELTFENLHQRCCLLELIQIRGLCAGDNKKQWCLSVGHQIGVAIGVA